MNPIILCRASYLALYTEKLRRMGFPVEHELTLAGLPVMFEEQPNSYVPVSPMITFIRRMEQKTGISDLGFQAAQDMTLSSLSDDLREAVRQAPDLETGLKLFCFLARLENSRIEFSIKGNGDDIRVCSNLVGNNNFDGLQYSEWAQNMAVITIVRQFAGPDWQPNEIAFISQFTPSSDALKLFPKTSFLTGKKKAWVEVPASLLSCPLRNNSYGLELKRDLNWERQIPVTLRLNFPESLKLAIKAYLDEKCPDVHFAAKIIAHCSVRSLQRHLAQFGVTYSGLIQQARFETATQLLKDPDIQVIDVAYAVGYQDPSHFTRAFRRKTGVCPREFRFCHKSGVCLREGSGCCQSVI